MWKGFKAMRKAVLDEAVELSKSMKKISSRYFASIFDDEVVLLIEDFLSRFKEYAVTKMSGNDIFVCKISAQYSGVKVSAYVKEYEVEKYGIQI